MSLRVALSQVSSFQGFKSSPLLVVCDKRSGLGEEEC